MTLLQTRPARPAAARTRRPLPLVAPLAGVAASAGPLVVCLAWGVIGWFVTDAGAHGQPSDGLAVGSLGWLSAHGSGLRIGRTPVTVMPLLLTWLCAVVTWRTGRRLGERIAAFGPDAEGLANGERDWTVPLATALFATGYGAVAWMSLRLVGGEHVVSAARLWTGVVLIAVGLGGGAIAVGSGRAAIALARVPQGVRAAVAVGGRIAWNLMLTSAVLLVASMLMHLDDAATMTSGVRADTGDTVLFWLANALLLPNAVGMSASYLLGPGFAVGAGTLVSTGSVQLGPLPVTPWLAALPAAGVPSGWTAAWVLLPAAVALLSAARGHLRYPTASWTDGALRALGGGIVAAVIVTVGVWLGGGKAGPGRMRVVGASAESVLVHGIAVLGLGALLGGLAMTWWWRRSLAARD